MRRSIIVLSVIVAVLSGQEMIVRVYTNSWDDLAKIDVKYNIDIVSARRGQYYDIMSDQTTFSHILGSGLQYEVILHSLEPLKDEVRANYLSYDEVNDSLEHLVLNFPSICALDSLPISTYQGRWLYGVKISDSPHIEEDDEAGFLIDGLHHSREWACIPVVMFFADSMLSAYGVVPEITEIINTTEIYCFPIINADGYVYDYPTGNWWRKNREPFGGSIGTDPNRNYPGCAEDALEGEWGAVDEGKATHYPTGETFCGAYVNSGDETRALAHYVKSHIINAYMSYHSSGELLMWPYGFTGQGTPDSALYAQKGTYMASLVQKLGGGTYDAGPVYWAIYAVSGSSMDWVYTWNHWVNGISNLSFTTELGTSFYQPQSDLDHICHQNFKALKYLAHFCDSIVLLTDGKVPQADIHPLGSVIEDFTVAWHPRNPMDNNPSNWELVELFNPLIVTDDIESGTARWVLDGFSVSTARAHSGSHSLFSGSANNMNCAVQSVHPYLVNPGDSVSFWCWYSLETNYDVAVVEVSENTSEWFNLDTTRFTGNSTSWTRKVFSLDPWQGKSLYFRFRAMTDNSVLDEGFYVDDIYPACEFQDVSIVSSSINDTLYAFVDHPLGEYYYLVRGTNMWGWGNYSCLEKANVVSGVCEKPPGSGVLPTVELAITPNPFRTLTTISFGGGQNAECTELKIYDISGRLVKSFSLSTTYSALSAVLWDGTNSAGDQVPAGVYMVRYTGGDVTLADKVVKIRQGSDH